MANKLQGRIVGIELYFDDLQKGKQFYGGNVGLELLDEQPGHHARFGGGDVFLCLERKGAESYPSRDKAVIFLEVVNLAEAVGRVGKEKVVQMKPAADARPAWAVLHDPEGYNIVMLEAPPAAGRADDTT